MMRTLAVMGFITLISMLAPEAAFCQPGATKPSFDIADVHLSPRSDWVKNSTHLMQGSGVRGRNRSRPYRDRHRWRWIDTAACVAHGTDRPETIARTSF